jgi:Protein of unknown function (DUF2723)
LGKNAAHILAAGAGVIAFIVYMMTLNPTVTFMDSGELAGALYTFGIPHPTGYPLFLILGYVFSHMPIGDSPVYRLNVMSAIFSSIAVVIFFYAVSGSLKLKESAKKMKSKDKKHAGTRSLDENSLVLLSFFSALILAFSRTFWSNALSVEVYPLHEVFVSLILLLSVKIYTDINNQNGKLWMWLFLVLGLSFANHMTTVLLIPGLLYLLYLQIKAVPAFKKKLFGKVVFVVPGLLMYFVLIVRAASGPFFNWSDPQNFGNLFHHLRGGDFDQMMFSSGSVFSINLSRFTGTLPTEFAFISFVLGLVGIVYVFSKNREIFYFLIILALSILIYSLNYNIRDVQVYFAAFYIIFALFAVFGFKYMLSLITGSKNAVKPAAAIVVLGLIVSGFGLYYNFSANDNSRNYVVEDLTLNTVNSLEPNSILISFDWGYSYPASMYYSQVKGVRQDVKTFNVKFFSVGWYLEMVKKYYPDIYEKCRAEIDDYIKNINSSDNVRVGSLNNLVKGFFAKTISSYPLYVTYDLLLNKDMKPILSGYGAQPSGYCYRLVNRNAAYDSSSGTKCLDMDFRPYITDTQEKKKVNSSVAGMLFETGNYHYRGGNSSLALRFLDKSIAVNNQIPDAVNLKNKILSERK